MFINIYVITICMVSVTHSVPLSEFFPYGPSANDEIFPINDHGTKSNKWYYYIFMVYWN